MNSVRRKLCLVPEVWVPPPGYQYNGVEGHVRVVKGELWEMVWEWLHEIR